jgi:hypothetical protein
MSAGTRQATATQASADNAVKSLAAPCRLDHRDRDAGGDRREHRAQPHQHAARQQHRETRRQRADEVAEREQAECQQQRALARPAAGEQQHEWRQHGGRHRIGRHRLARGGQTDTQIARQRRQDAADHEGGRADDEIDEGQQPKQAGHWRARHRVDCAVLRQSLHCGHGPRFAFTDRVFRWPSTSSP